MPRKRAGPERILPTRAGGRWPPRRRINHRRAGTRLPSSHGDIGSTPRLIGSYHAIGLGSKLSPSWTPTTGTGPTTSQIFLAEMDQHQADFVSCSRTLCRLDGSVMGPCPLTNADHFVDTNAMLFGRGSFHLLHNWVLMPNYGHLIGDRIMLHHLKQSGINRKHVNQESVFYRCAKEGLYQQMNNKIPPGVTRRPDYEASFQAWEDDGHPPLV